MQLFCQTCQAAFAGTSHCPKCGGRLLAPQESFIYSGTPQDPPAESVPATTPGRIAVGLGVAFGLYLGLRELALAAGVVGSGGPADGGFDFALRLFAVLAGALLAGAGLDQGLPAGLGVGGIAAGLFLVADTYAAGGPAAAGWVAPAAAGVIALLAGPAGAVGARVWPAPADLPSGAAPTKASSRGSSLADLVGEGSIDPPARPTVWLRVLAGAAVAAAGLLLSEDIRLWLARGSAGLLQTGGNYRGPFVGLQIAAFLLLLGGVVAGAGTGAGFRHGLLAGLLVAVGALAVANHRPDRPLPAVDGYFLTFDRPVQRLADRTAAAEVLGVAAVLCTAGGWLGGQLFLPLAPKSMRRRRLPSQS